MEIQKDINKEVLKSDEEKVEDLAKDAEDLEKAVEKDIEDKVEKVEEINDAEAEPLDAKDGSGKPVKAVVASDKEFKEEQEHEDVEFQEVKKSELEEGLTEAKKTLDDVYEDQGLESIWETKWKELVPASGKAKTPIGEVMRCFAKVSHEYFQNGSILGKGWNNKSNYDAANDMDRALQANGLNDNELCKLWDKIWATRSEAAYDHYLAEFYEKFINKYLKNDAVSEGLKEAKGNPNADKAYKKFKETSVKPFTEKLELNEAAETQTEIKELLSDYLLHELEESEFMDNLAWRAEHDVPGYNHDWCAEEASPDYKEKQYEYIDALADDLMAMCPLEESLKEDLMSSSWGSNFQSDVYNALADIAFKYYKKNINITEDDWNDAIEWFMTHFFESDDNPFDPFGESLEEDNDANIRDLKDFSWEELEGLKGKTIRALKNIEYGEVLDFDEEDRPNFKKAGLRVRRSGDIIIPKGWQGEIVYTYSYEGANPELGIEVNDEYIPLAIAGGNAGEFGIIDNIDSLKESKLNESDNDDLRKDAQSLSDYLSKNKLYCDLEDYEMYPMGVKVVTFRVEGDWKHDHWYFEDLVRDWAKENGKEIFKMDEHTVEEDGSDYYTADHKVYITDKETSDRLNSMRGLFAPREESLKEDVELWDSDRVVDLARYYVNKYPDALDEQIIKAIIKTMQKQGATLPSDLKEVEKVYYSTVEEDADYEMEYGEPYDESLKENLSTKEKRNALYKMNSGNTAHRLEAMAKKYQPNAKSLDDLTDEVVEKVYSDMKNYFSNELEKYGDDAELDTVLYDVFNVNESKLDEAIPREVAQALKNSNNQEIKNSGGAKYKIPGMSKYRSDDINSKDALNKSNVDYEKAEFKKISKEEALNIYKTEPQNLLLIVSDDQGYGNVEQKAIWFEANGDRSGRAENVPDEKAPRRRDGSLITDTKYMTIRQLIDCADSCYWTNQRDVTRDPVLQDIRSKNPESRNYTGLNARDIEQEYSPKNSGRYYVDNNVSRGVSPEYGWNSWTAVRQRRYDNLKARIEDLEAELSSGNLDRSEKISKLERLQGLKSELSQLEDTRAKAIGAEKDYNARKRYLTAEQAQRSTMKKFIDLKNAVENADWDLKNAQRNLDDVRKQGGTWSNDYDRRKVSNYTDQIRRLQAQIADYQRMIDELNTKLSSQQVSEEDAKAIADAEAKFAEVQNRVQSQKDELNSILDRARARRQNTESLEEDLKVTINFDSFEPYGQAVDTYNRIKDANKLDEADAILEELYPDGIDEASLNDILAYSPEWLLNELGLAYDEEKAMLDIK